MQLCASRSLPGIGADEAGADGACATLGAVAVDATLGAAAVDTGADGDAEAGLAAGAEDGSLSHASPPNAQTIGRATWRKRADVFIASQSWIVGAAAPIIALRSSVVQLQDVPLASA